MKRAIMSVLTIVGLVCSLSVHAADVGKEKEKTVTGIAKCAKCVLKESDTCQNVVEVRKGNKKTSYYLADNDVSKSFHESICKGPKNVKATFKVAGEKGKEVYTPTKIELVEGK